MLLTLLGSIMCHKMAIFLRSKFASFLTFLLFVGIDILAVCRYHKNCARRESMKVGAIAGESLLPFGFLYRVGLPKSPTPSVAEARNGFLLPREVRPF